MASDTSFLYDDKKYSFKNEEEGIISIINTINAFKSSFSKEFDTCMNDTGFTFNNKESVKDLVILLFFGEKEDSSMCSNKLDFNKNKSLLKTCLLNEFGINSTVRILKKLTIIVNDFFLELSGKFDEVHNISVRNNTYKEHDICKIQDMIDSFLFDSTNIREKASNLIYTTDNIVQDQLLCAKITECKSDSLKKYYFTHVYDLKNNIKIFDKDTMVYGEINNIMRIFDNIFNFLFGDIVFMFNTVDTLFKSFTVKTK